MQRLLTVCSLFTPETEGGQSSGLRGDQTQTRDAYASNAQAGKKNCSSRKENGPAEHEIKDKELLLTQLL